MIVPMVAGVRRPSDKTDQNTNEMYPMAERPSQTEKRRDETGVRRGRERGGGRGRGGEWM